jgi:hypothetical protein
MPREAATVIATASIAGKARAEAGVLAVLVRVSRDPGAGMGSGLLLAHWHPEVGLPFSCRQQQQPWPDCDFPQQQWAMSLPQHDAF